METNGREATHVGPGEGKALWVAGDLITLKVVGRMTDGACTLVEETTPPQGGPPPHIHSREDEVFYVLEGELEFLVGERTIPATAGDVFHGPRGVPHTFKNVGAAPSRVLVAITPAGLEGFWEEVGEPATDLSSPPSGPPDIEKILSTAKKYGVEILPPPEQ